jgi:GBP family porin
MREASMSKRATVGLALLALFFGGAFAQQPAALYGIIDVGVQWNKQYASSTNRQASVWSIDSGYQSGSRFGVRGSEPLGGTFAAIYQLEGGFDVSTGQSTQGGALFGRQAWAGLQGSLGQLVAGRLATPSSGTCSFDMWAAVDPFAGGFGVNQSGSTFVAANYLREDNAVLWVTPALGGFKGAIGYSFNRGGTETAPQESNSSAVNLAASYSAGAIYAVVTYDTLSYPDGGSATANAGYPDEKLFQFGATLDLKVVKLHGAWADQSNISAVRAGVSIAPPASVVAYDNQAWMAGVSLPVGRGSLMASYQYANASNVAYATDAGTAYFEPDYSVWGLAYTYPMSMRTNIYLGYGQVLAKGTLDSTQVDRQQAAFGLRHRF